MKLAPESSKQPLSLVFISFVCGYSEWREVGKDMSEEEGKGAVITVEVAVIVK